MKNEVNSPNAPWWNIHIDEKNTEWLAENVNGVDHCVKEMLVLLEQVGSVDKVDNNDNANQSDLIAHVNEISNRHHSLADVYAKLTEELRTHIKSTCAIGNFSTPEKKLGMNNDNSQVVSSNISLSSAGGTSDGSCVADSGSSFSSDSDSEYASPTERLSSISKGKTVNMETEPIVMGDLTEHELEYDMVKDGDNDECETLLRRISEYEEKLKLCNEKLKFAEEKILEMKRELQNNEAIMVSMGSVELELASARNQIRLHENQINMDNQRSLFLQTEIVELEAKLESKKMQVLEMQESVNKYMEELSSRDLQIQKLNDELQDASGSFALEKWHLESCVNKLTERVTYHVAKNEELHMEFESLSNELTECENSKAEMEIKWRNDFELMKLEIQKKNDLVDNLNNNLDDLKHDYNMGKAEKDEINAKFQSLSAEIVCHDNQIQLLEKNLRELLSDNNQLRASSEISNKEKVELKFKIEELEEELGRQSVILLERSEEKREAIRQLCFSLDYYKSAYEEILTKCAFRKPTHSYGARDMILAA